MVDLDHFIKLQILFPHYLPYPLMDPYEFAHFMGAARGLHCMGEYSQCRGRAAPETITLLPA
jgi:hypothetical protein